MVIAACCWGCDSTPAPAVAPAPTIVPVGPGDGVLFVGNSLTYANDLPGIVEGLAIAAGGRLQTASVAYPAYSLGDHLTQGDALRSIASKGWRVVVLQQGPSGLEESRRLLRMYTALFDPHVRAAGARTALFSVWPDSAFGTSFPEVAESYSLAASDVGGIYLPVTDAWTLAWQRDSSLRLYSADGFHPSEQGSYLSALVIAGVLTAQSPVGMAAHVVRPSGHELSIPPDLAGVLQGAAAAAVAAYARP
jgi:hypothetical protein